jgi:hypothetical protein
MDPSRGNAELTVSGIEVLRLVRLKPPGSWLWRAEDLNDSAAVGTIFWCYAEGQEVGYLMVAEVAACRLATI